MQNYRIIHYAAANDVNARGRQLLGTVCYQPMAEDVARRALRDPWLFNVYQGQPYRVCVVHEESGAVTWTGTSAR